MRTTAAKRNAGRQLTLVLDQDMIPRIDQFMAQEGIVSAGEAIRMLIRLALSSDYLAAVRDARARRAYRNEINWIRERFAAWCIEMRNMIVEVNRIEVQSGLVDPIPSEGGSPDTGQIVQGDQNEDQVGYTQDPNR